MPTMMYHVARWLASGHADDDDSFVSSHSKYYPHGGNSSITTSVTIHVTPEHYHILNWSILWGSFILGIVLASYQVRLENQQFASRRRDDIEHQQGGVHEGEGVSTADWTRRNVSNLLENDFVIVSSDRSPHEPPFARSY